MTKCRKIIFLFFSVINYASVMPESKNLNFPHPIKNPLFPWLFHSGQTKQLEQGNEPGMEQTWIHKDCQAASVSVCAPRKTPGKELLVAFTGQNDDRGGGDLQPVIPQQLRLTAFLAEASFTHPCLSTTNLFKTKPICSSCLRVFLLLPYTGRRRRRYHYSSIQP